MKTIKICDREGKVMWEEPIVQKPTEETLLELAKLLKELIKALNKIQIKT